MGDFVAYSSRWRMVVMALGAAAFVGLGLWMGGAFGPPPSSRNRPDVVVFALGWISVAFFGFCGVMAVKRLFDTSVQLQIGPPGIYWASWSDKTIPWSEITDVTTSSIKGQKMIVLHLRRPACFPRRGSAGMFASADRIFASANRILTGGNIAIPLTGMNRSFDEAMSAIARFRC